MKSVWEDYGHVYGNIFNIMHQQQPGVQFTAVFSSVCCHFCSLQYITLALLCRNHHFFLLKKYVQQQETDRPSYFRTLCNKAG
jgi:hypothetical protein